MLQDDDIWIYVNLFNNETIRCSASEQVVVQEILEQPNSRENFNEIRLHFFKLLIDKGFIISESLSEINELERLFISQKFFPKEASFALVLTHDCNLRCIYCNQDHKRQSLSLEDERSFILLVSEAISRVSSINLTWWGGEPLLKIDMIGRISGELIDLCDKNGVHYSAFTSTNGVLLTKENAQKLLSSRLNSIQVSIDGPPSHHDFHRPNIGGRGTYEKVIAGLTNTHHAYAEAGLDLSLIVRVNVSKRTPLRSDDWKSVFDDLEDSKSSVRLSFVPVVSTFRIDDDLVFKSADFHDAIAPLKAYATDRGFKIAEDSIVGRKGRLHCGAVSNENWFVLPGRRLTKCTMHFDDPSEDCGSFDEHGNITLLDRAKNWMNFSPFEHALCKNCDVLPACMGGCQVMPFDHPSGQRCHAKRTIESAIRRDLRKETVPMLSKN